ncbi:MAG: hypothetical protein HRT81_01065 [Henriciella sp.]|nr:hypothetical protein [Henriciella sp.]
MAEPLALGAIAIAASMAFGWGSADRAVNGIWKTRGVTLGVVDVYIGLISISLIVVR